MNVSQNVSDNPQHVSPELPAEIAEEKSAYLYVIAVLAAYVTQLQRPINLVVYSNIKRQA